MRTTLLLMALCLASLAAPARAADNAAREAGKHFQRGVDLYNDGDFRGALVEFKKAYSTWPRANVLYDIGQTEYQLLDYAAALKTLERYLAETGPTAAHRPEVESTVETLRGRVGKLAISTDAAGCDVLVDDQPAGTTPIDTVVIVSVGTRRVALNCAGRPGASKQVEVAAGEVVRVDLHLPSPPIAAVRGLGGPDVHADKNPLPSRTGLSASWTVTGLAFAATAAVGVAALVEASRLNGLKTSFLPYPTTMDQVLRQKDQLDRQTQLSSGLALGADVLGLATLVGASVSTYLTVKYVREKKLRLGVSGRSVSLSANF